MKLLSICFSAFILSVSFSPVPLWAAETSLKADLQHRSLQYFLDHSNPVTGLTLDRAENFIDEPEWNRVASIAATGFSLAVISHAALQGGVTREYAQAYVLKTLQFAKDHVPRRKGWFLHFVDWETGERMWVSEYSTIDTALFMAGALYAAQVFPENKTIATLAHQMFNDMDFYDAMTDGGTKPDKRALSMAYMEGIGFTGAQWDMYAEQRLLLLMGLGHPTKPLPPEAWLVINRSTTNLPNGDVGMGVEAALFIHQYTEVFVDFRQFNDGFRNYFDNGRIMSEYHRQISKTDTRFKTFTDGFWGFSAGDSPSGYKVWNPLHYQSTVCLGCAIGSAMYMPQVILEDAAKWLAGPYRSQIWGRYGFSDSIDIDQNWFGPHVLGITVGPEYMALANTDENTSIWKDFMKIPEIKRGLERAAAAQQGSVSNSQATVPIAR